jgi:hypothetical protein
MAGQYLMPHKYHLALHFCGVPSPHLALAPQPSVHFLLRILHLPPADFSFGCQVRVDEWTKIGEMLGFWLVAVL